MTPLSIIAAGAGVVAARRNPWAILATSAAVLVPYPLSIPLTIYLAGRTWVSLHRSLVHVARGDWAAALGKPPEEEPKTVA